MEVRSIWLTLAGRITCAASGPGFPGRGSALRPTGPYLPATPPKYLLGVNGSSRSSLIACASGSS